MIRLCSLFFSTHRTMPTLDRSAQKSDQTLFEWLKKRPSRKRPHEPDCEDVGSPPPPKRTNEATPIDNSVDDAIFDDAIFDDAI
jgi:hypothetical protein